MVHGNRGGAIGAFLGVSVVLLAAGCPFEEQLYGAGATGVGGSGDPVAGTQTGTTVGQGSGGGFEATTSGSGGSDGSSGSGGSDGSSGSGGSGGAVDEIICPVPDKVKDPSGQEFEIYHFSYVNPTQDDLKKCYGLFILNETGADWFVARDTCVSLKDANGSLKSYLVVIRDLNEHNAIVSNLSELKGPKGVNFNGPWTRGRRNLKDTTPAKNDDAGSFVWDNPFDSTDPQEPWEIFPCKGNDCENNKAAFWGKHADEGQQPDDQPKPEDVFRGVRYGILGDWGDPNGAPGLADNPCTEKRAFICEWSP
jgi:hypothetical protein